MIFGKTTAEKQNRLPKNKECEANQKQVESTEDHEGVATVRVLGDPRRRVWSDPGVSEK